ncbi:Short-chain dehydrogenase/reductase SDR [Botryosphaeria dothidea]|uniref:Short-chain dehydrogenase/reductase SDR n=1 Tax=Botryosphaeria dothidea TaxID=55169 RepID=A0A8H4N6Q3_9PEZI|nr:Short-chain dehydrogenase/reductase SDR [Botryosphaeria dothidea]
MSAPKLSTQTVLVIGGTSGIGLAVASEALAQSASHVTISGSQPPKLSAALDTLRAAHPAAASAGRISGYACDLSRADTLEEDLKALLDAAVGGNGTGKIDHVIYTAGDYLGLVPIGEFSVLAIQRAGVVRFLGPLVLAKLLPSYVAAGHRSSLTLTSGVNAQRPAPGWTLPATYGNALMGMMRGFAVDLKPLRVNLVAPGAVETPRWDRLPADGRDDLKRRFVEKTTLGRIGQPEDVAEAYVYLMKDHFVTGAFVASDGGALLV